MKRKRRTPKEIRKANKLKELRRRTREKNGLKARARAAFNKEMRSKGAVDGMIKCITCDRKYPVGDSALNAGHFKHGTWTKKSGFYENNVWPQCVFCNCGGGTNGGGDKIADIYEQKMIEKLGMEEVEKIKALSHQIWKPTNEEVLEIIAKYEKPIEGTKLEGLK